MSRKIALIIGNNEYEDRSLAQLNTPKADVSALANILRAADIGSFDEVITLVNESAKTVRIAIARFFADKKRDDLLVLYFSGHGVLDERGQLYLAVKDTERILPKGTAIEASFITDVMDSSNSRRQVLILDCCHSGAFARGTKGTPGASVHTGTAFEGIGTGRVVLTATDATQYAWEGDQVTGQAETSVFTRYVIQGLQTGEADADMDGNITLDELYDYAYSQVVTETPKQTPGKWSYRQQGDIIIARNPRPITKQGVLPTEIQQSIDDSRPWVREGVISELNRLLNGRDPALAQAAHVALKHLAEDDSRKVASAAAQSLIVHEAGLRTEAERVEREGREQKRSEAEPLAIENAPQKMEAEHLAVPKAEEQRLAQEKVKDKTLLHEKTDATTAPTPQLRRLFTRSWILGGLIVLGMLVGLYVILSAESSKAPGATVLRTPIHTASPAPTFVAKSQLTLSADGMTSTRPAPAEATSTLAPGKTPTPTLAPGTSRTRQTDGMTMVYVPAGNLKMGSETGELDEKPIHDVTLDAFWFDQTEVSNAEFNMFVAGTGYRTDAEKLGTGWVYDASKNKWNETRGADWQHPHGPASNLNERDDHPVVQVSWNDADAYCRWAGGQLPTEAQWEYAARGPQGYTYPWGNDAQNAELANYDLKVGDTTPVSSYPDGASWVGALNMAGNAWEWERDWYGPYTAKPQANPTGPRSGDIRVLRGGPWNLNAYFERTTYRSYGPLDGRNDTIGFRCMVVSEE